jgi:DNA-binding MarR family transcriptional regulator
MSRKFDPVGAQETEATAAAPTPAANEAWRLVAEMFMGRSGHAAAIAAELGLTPGHMKTLMVLSPDEAKPMGALAEILHCDASNATWLVDRLEERGYVERRSHPSDRRVRTVALLPAGIEVRAQIEAKLYEAPPEFEALDADELDTLCRLLRKVAPTA